MNVSLINSPREEMQNKEINKMHLLYGTEGAESAYFFTSWT